MSQFTQHPDPQYPQGSGSHHPDPQYGQPQYPNPPHPQPPRHAGGPVPGQTARNGAGVASLILGLIGAASGCIPLMFWLAGILGIIALVLGLVGRGRAKRGEATNKKTATAGAILGLLSLILSVVGMVITFKAVGDAVDEIDKATSSSSATKKSGDDTPDKAKGGSAEDGDSVAAKTLGGGDSAAYDDDLVITVSKPAPYSPGEFAIGHTEGNKAYKVSVVIENNGKKKFDANLVTAQARAGADGVEAEEIYDDKVGEISTGSVLPGKKITVALAFDAPADAKTLTVEVTPDFTHNGSQWELTL